MLCLVLLPTGCASTPTEIRNVPTPDCSAWQFISVADDDVLTDQTARQIVANDQNWLKLCGDKK